MNETKKYVQNFLITYAKIIRDLSYFVIVNSGNMPSLFALYSERDRERKQRNVIFILI